MTFTETLFDRDHFKLKCQTQHSKEKSLTQHAQPGLHQVGTLPAAPTTRAAMLGVRLALYLPGGRPGEWPVAGAALVALCRVPHPHKHHVLIVALLVGALEHARSDLFVIIVAVVIQQHLFPKLLEVHLGEEGGHGASHRLVGLAGVEDPALVSRRDPGLPEGAPDGHVVVVIIIIAETQAGE